MSDWGSKLVGFSFDYKYLQNLINEYLNPISILITQDPGPKILVLHCHIFSRWGRHHVSVCFDYPGSQYIKERE